MELLAQICPPKSLISKGILIPEKEIETYVTGKGYTYDRHDVETEDGFYLGLFHIQKIPEENLKFPSKPEKENQRKKLKIKKKIPVLFMHGLLDSSDGWLINKEEKNLPLILASCGFDIWLGNARGNKYSRTHKWFEPENFEFWQFTFDEMGKYDLPALIKYIRKLNPSKEKIIYIGHSQGTTSFFSGMSLNPNFFKENINIMVALAPIARLTNMSSNFLKVLEGSSIHKLLKGCKVKDVFYSGKESSSSTNPNLSNLGLTLMTDDNSKEYNDSEQISFFMRHFPSGTSLKNLIHFTQLYKSNKFCQYNYGSEANFAIYQSKEPMEYNLNNLTGKDNVKFIFVCGKNDKLADVEDVKWLYNQICDNVLHFSVNENMGYSTFLVGKDINWFTEPLRIILQQIGEKEI